MSLNHAAQSARRLARYLLLFEIFINAIQFGLIFVAIGHDANSTVECNSLNTLCPTIRGPCSYFVQAVNGVYTVTAHVGIGGLVAGQQASSSAGQDFGSFFRPFIQNEITLGHGDNCLEPGTYIISTSQTCTILGVSTTCGLWMHGHGIVFSCPIYERDNGGSTSLQPGLSPCMIIHGGQTVIQCLLCWGEESSGKEWNGGGASFVFVQGNQTVNDCVDFGDIQDFAFRWGGVVNCLNYGIHVIGVEPGGVSNGHVDSNLIGTENPIGPHSMTGVWFDTGTANSFIIANFFTTLYGYGVLVTTGATTNTNHIQFNHFEQCLNGSGQFKAGTCIYDASILEDINGNVMAVASYDCIYGGATGQIITSNSCYEPNQSGAGDGSCIFVENSPSNFQINTNSCFDDTKKMVYGIDCFACGENISITGNNIRGAQTRSINFFGGASEGILGLETWNNPGFNDFVGKIASPFCSTCTDNGKFAGAIVPPVQAGTLSASMAASTTYTIAFTNDVFLCSTGSAVGGGVTIKDIYGNVIVNNVAIATFCSAVATTPFTLNIGYTITFGAFTGTPTETVFAT